MAIIIANNISNSKTELTGLSTDIKPSIYNIGSELTETDTGRKFIWDGTSWKGINFPIGPVIGTASFTMTSITSGNTVSATFTMPTGGTFGTVAVSIYNPTTNDLTCNIYSQETLGTATRSCYITGFSVTKSSSLYQQVTGAFLGTDALMQLSPTGDCNTASGTALVKIRGVKVDY